MEEPGILKHHTEGTAQLSALDLGDVHAMNQNLAAIDFVEAHQQIDQRGLAGSGRSYDGDHLSRLDVDIHVLHQDGVGLITEPDMLELHGTRSSLEGGCGGGIDDVRRLLRLVQQLKDSLRRSHGRLDDVGDSLPAG